jgi:UDP-2,3-diacylglucosamine pyrophosphatase LpxH
MKYRSIFISDTHLGFRGCQAAKLLDFLENVECEYLYLVGDIIDLWALSRSNCWKHKHTKIINQIIKIARGRTAVVYVPGNHDDAIRQYLPMVFEYVSLQDTAAHVCANGLTLKVMHGDQFDKVVLTSKWLAVIGSTLYDAMIYVNHHVNALRAKLGRPPWSLASYLKRKVKNAVKYVSSFEDAASQHALVNGFDGIVCGHVHQATVTEINGVTYANCGDWVESCTALVEHESGRLSVVRFD